MDINHDLITPLCNHFGAHYVVNYADISETVNCQIICSLIHG